MSLQTDGHRQIDYDVHLPGLSWDNRHHRDCHRQQVERKHWCRNHQLLGSSLSHLHPHSHKLKLSIFFLVVLFVFFHFFFFWFKQVCFLFLFLLLSSDLNRFTPARLEPTCLASCYHMLDTIRTFQKTVGPPPRPRNTKGKTKRDERTPRQREVKKIPI